MAFADTLHTHTHMRRLDAARACAPLYAWGPGLRAALRVGSGSRPAIWARAGWDGEVAGRVWGWRAGGAGPGGPGGLAGRVGAVAGRRSKERAPKLGRIGNLEKGCSGLEKSCHHMEDSGKMLEKKNSIIEFMIMKKIVKSYVRIICMNSSTNSGQQSRLQNHIMAYEFIL